MASYDACAEFVKEFDRLYEGKPGSYADPNPMRKKEGVNLSNERDVKMSVFNDAHLPTKYCFNQDARGVATNPTACHDDVWPPQPDILFHLEDPTNNNRLKVDSCSHEAGLSIVQRDSNDPVADTELFYYGKGQKIYSLKCEGKWLEFESQVETPYTNQNVPCPEASEMVKLGPLTPDFGDQSCREECSNGKCTTVCPWPCILSCHHRTFGKWKFGDDGSIYNAECPKNKFRRTSGKVEARNGTPSKWVARAALPHKRCDMKVAQKAAIRQCDAR